MSESRTTETRDDVKENLEYLKGFENLTIPKNEAEVAMSADTVQIALTRCVEAGQMSDDEKGAILWFFSHVKGRKMTFTDAAKAIKYNSSTVSRLFKGSYEGNVANIVSAIMGYKRTIDEQERMQSDVFIETSIWKKCSDACLMALRNNVPVRVVGLSQIGKTCALKEFVRRAQYRAIYARIPAAPTFRSAVQAVADACKVTSRNKSDVASERVKKSIDRYTLLIVDELHELAISANHRVALKVMEWLREIYDETGCGMVLCGTDTMEQDLIYGRDRGWLDQFDQRCAMILNLPKKIPADDIKRTADAYGMPPPGADEMVYLRELRMNRLCLAAKLTRIAANKRGISPDWDLFKTTLDTMRGVR